MKNKNMLAALQSLYADSDDIWFFVKDNYRITHFNSRTAANSLALHKKEIAAGDSILDYARDTSNKIDGKFITCFGKAAAGQAIEAEQRICYREEVIWTRCTYTPVYEDARLLGISIVVSDITDQKAATEQGHSPEN